MKAALLLLAVGCAIGAAHGHMIRASRALAPAAAELAPAAADPADPAGKKMLMDKDAECTDARLVKELKNMKDSEHVVEMLRAWTTFMMTGTQPYMSKEAMNQLKARKQLQDIWDLNGKLLTHKQYTTCPKRHVFWTDFSAGAKHLAQKFVRFISLLLLLLRRRRRRRGYPRPNHP